MRQIIWNFNDFMYICNILLLNPTLMTHAEHRTYKKVDQRNRPCDLPVMCLYHNIPIEFDLQKYSKSPTSASK